MATSRETIAFAAGVTTAADPSAVMDVLRDLPAHLEWAGSRSPQKKFRLLGLDAPGGRAVVGTRFTSTGANMNGTFHDESVVTVVEPLAFGFETASRLDRRHGPELHMRFVHRYAVEPHTDGSRVAYTCHAYDPSYTPYWLRPGMRAMTRWMVQRSMTKQLRLLAELAEQRAATSVT